jgi:hypothetical protein
VREWCDTLSEPLASERCVINHTRRQESARCGAQPEQEGRGSLESATQAHRYTRARRNTHLEEDGFVPIRHLGRVPTATQVRGHAPRAAHTEHREHDQSEIPRRGEPHDDDQQQHFPALAVCPVFLFCRECGFRVWASRRVFVALALCTKEVDLILLQRKRSSTISSSHFHAHTTNTHHTTTHKQNHTQQPLLHLHSKMSTSSSPSTSSMWLDSASLWGEHVAIPLVIKVRLGDQVRRLGECDTSLRYASLLEQLERLFPSVFPSPFVSLHCPRRYLPCST